MLMLLNTLLTPEMSAEPSVEFGDHYSSSKSAICTFSADSNSATCAVDSGTDAATLAASLALLRSSLFRSQQGIHWPVSPRSAPHSSQRVLLSHGRGGQVLAGLLAPPEQKYSGCES